MAWRLLGGSPEINVDSIRSLYSSAPAETDGPNTIHGRLLVHVAFHFNPARLAYLTETIRSLSTLPFEHVRIVVDTNTDRTVHHLPSDPRSRISDFIVHDRLRHPFLLTWAHRDGMLKALPDFDYFMYIEDDILVTAESVLLWHRRLADLKAMDYLPGFVRIEKNRTGKWVFSDIPGGTRSFGNVLSVDGSPYLHSAFPYQAFWLLDKSTMLRFVADPQFRWGPKDRQTRIGLRERAAFGFTYEREPSGSLRSRHLVPLLADSSIDPRAFVFHVPSNYGKRVLPHAAGLGTIEVDCPPPMRQ